MLPALNRLRRARDLTRVQRSRVAFRTPRLILKVARRDDSLPPRIAFAVGRRVSKRAVQRNRVARRLREAVRRELPGLAQGADLRFSAIAPSAEYSFQRCREDVHELLMRARLLRRAWGAPS